MLSVKKCLTDIVNYIAGINDYIVDTGTIGQWNYIKYKSGNCIVWGRNVVTGKYVQTWNGLMEVDFSVTLPFAISQGQIAGSAYAGTGFGWLSSTTGWRDSTNTVTLTSLGSQPNTTVRYYLSIVGKYK